MSIPIWDCEFYPHVLHVIKFLIDSMLIVAYVDNNCIMQWIKRTYLRFVTWYIIFDILIVSIIMESA